MKCSWCYKKIIRNLTFKEILFPFSIQIQRCSLCEAKLTKITGLRCPKCMKKNAGICTDCQLWQQHYPDYSFQHTALFDYNKGFKEWLHMYKFTGDYRLRMTFVSEMKQQFQQKKNVVICPIPLSEEKYQKRGFNQVAELLSAADIPFQTLLIKNDSTQAQAQKNRQERLQTPQSFSLKVPDNYLSNKEIILVDDIYTTGRTLFHAASVILNCCPKKITTFSLAR